MCYLFNSDQILSSCLSLELFAALPQAALLISSGANEHSNLKRQTTSILFISYHDTSSCVFSHYFTQRVHFK